MLLAAIISLGVPGLRASSPADRAKTYFDEARAAHSQLQKVPIAKRTAEDYTRLVESFRRVYLTAPHYGNSTISLMAIGELSEEMARRWSEHKYFQQAIDAYTFILREYPQSQFRFDARLALARIYRYDLKQPEKALQQFERYLVDYPNSAQSKMARLAATQLRDELGPSTTASDSQAGRSKQGTLSGKPVGDISVQAKPVASQAKPETSATPQAEPSPLASITDIRYWTNPETSRVVIDVAQLGDGQKLKYEAAQLTSPPRLYIDLKDTRIPKPAGGRTMEVNSDLLKRVRLAQFDKRVSRLVLDLGADTDYEISEVTSPYRLVIDLHNKVSDIDAAIPVATAAPKSTPSPIPAVVAGQAATVAAPASGAKPQDSIPLVSRVPPTPPASMTSAAMPAAVSVAPVTTAPPAVNVVSKNAERQTTAEVPRTPKQELPVQDNASAIAIPPAAKEKSATTVPVQIASAATPKTDRNLTEAKSADAEPQARVAAPTHDGMHSLTRALGLKIGRIFIDAGHGGHDTGTIGPGGLTEKEVSLDVAQRLGRLIAEKLGSEVVYSREGDSFVPLEDRVFMANHAGADLFVSVHLNSSTARNATGIETYYLNFTSDPEALKVAARENSGAQETIANLQGIVRKIALQEKLDESKEFASRMQASLRKSLANGMTRKAANQFDRGVKTAPFVVLIGANMPSILAEASFLSNPAEEKRLRTAEHRQKLADALFAGVSSYVDSLSGVKIAPRITPNPSGTPTKRDNGAPAKAQYTTPSDVDGTTSRQTPKPESVPATTPDDVASLH